MKNCENYRDIALLNVSYKICIKYKLSKYSEKILGEYQNGFRKSRSVIDQIFVLDEIQSASQEHKLKTYVLFVDLSRLMTASSEGNSSRHCKILEFLENN